MMFTEAQIDAVAIAAIQGEGFTAYNGSEEYAGRYIVGGLGTVSFPLGTPSVRPLIASLAERGRHAETLGSWYSDGTVFIDLGDTWTHESAAIQAAQYRGELAIWDRLTNSEILVPKG